MLDFDVDLTPKEETEQLLQSVVALDDPYAPFHTCLGNYKHKDGSVGVKWFWSNGRGEWTQHQLLTNWHTGDMTTARRGRVVLVRCYLFNILPLHHHISQQIWEKLHLNKRLHKTKHHANFVSSGEVHYKWRAKRKPVHSRIELQELELQLSCWLGRPQWNRSEVTVCLSVCCQSQSVGQSESVCLSECRCCLSVCQSIGRFMYSSIIL